MGLQRQIEKELDEYNKNKVANTERRDVTAEDIADVVSTMTGIPSKNISQDDTEKLINLGTEMKQDVIGQDDVVDKIVRSVLRNKAGLGDTKDQLVHLCSLDQQVSVKRILLRN